MNERWFRYYDTALDDPKVQSLPGDLFKIWVNLLCVASKNGGELPSGDLSFLMRMEPAELDKAIKSLMAKGLIDKTKNGLEPHNWNGRQFKSDVSSERMKRHRKRHSDDRVTPSVTPNVTSHVTPNVTPPESDTDTERKKEKNLTAKKERKAALRAQPVFSNLDPPPAEPPQPPPEPPPKPPPAPIKGADPNGSDEDVFWHLAGELQAKRVARSLCGKLANLLNGDFERGVSILHDVRNAKGSPSAYLAKIVRNVEREDDEDNPPPPPADEGPVPEWVDDARAYGWRVTKRGKLWLMNGCLWDDEYELVDSYPAEADT